MAGTDLQDWLRWRWPRPHRDEVASLLNYSGVWGQPSKARLKLPDGSLLSLSLSFVEKQVWLE